MNTDQALLRMNQVLEMASLVVQRQALMNGLGQSFDGERDYYKTFGYPKVLQFQDYWNLYERDEMAGTIAEYVPNETWRESPILIDGDSRSDAEEGQTPFLEAWNNIDNKNKILNQLVEADIVNAYSQYSILFLGVPGRYEQPLSKGGEKKLFFLSVHNESNAVIVQKDTNTQSERYGLPLFYDVTFEEEGLAQKVHWTRVLHFKQGNTGSRTHGRPRLKRLFNRFMDWQKVMGGGSEAFWLLVNRGMAFIAEEDAILPAEGSAEADELDNQIEAFMHQMQRYLKLEGIKPIQFDSQVVSSKDQAATIARALSAGSRIPQRKLIGSEAGELASTQDDENWNDYVDERRTNYAENDMLRPTIKRLVNYGILPPPSVGLDNLKIEWPELVTPTEDEEVTLANKVANMINTLTGGMLEQYVDMEKFFDVFYPRAKVAINPNPNIELPEDEGDEDDDAEA
jgi:hypothetical protein